MTLMRSVRRVGKKAIHQGRWRETGAELFGVKRMMGGDLKQEKWGQDRQTGGKTERSGDGQRAICGKKQRGGRNKGRGMKGEERDWCFKEISLQIARMRQRARAREWWWESHCFKGRQRENVSVCEGTINAYRVCFNPVWLTRLFAGFNVHNARCGKYWSIHPWRKKPTCSIKPLLRLLVAPPSLFTHTPNKNIMKLLIITNQMCIMCLWTKGSLFLIYRIVPPLIAVYVHGCNCASMLWFWLGESWPVYEAP